MRPVRIHVVSSPRGSALAKALRDYLCRQRKDLDVRLSSNADLDSGGRTSLAALTVVARECDFALIFFTRHMATEETANACDRENLLFLIGLFAGALTDSSEKPRCYLLSSLSPGALPARCRSIPLLRISEPDDLGDESDCLAAVRGAASEVLDKIQSWGRYERSPFITTEELFQAETLTSKGGDLLERSEVVVSASGPMELDEDFAARTLANMQSGVCYTYYFSKQADLRLIAQFFHAIVTVPMPSGLDKGSWGTGSASERLTQMCKHLAICFFADEPLFEFCIHNASNDRLARCYLRDKETESHRPRFLQWHFGAPAKRIAERMDEQVITRSEARNFIFHSTFNVNLCDKKLIEFRRELENQFLSLFDESLQEQIRGLLFPPDKSIV